MFPIVIGLFNLIIVALLVRALWMIVRLLRYGRTFATCPSFPFYLGSTLSVDVALPRAVRQGAPLTATLRCIQEVQEADSESTTTHVMEVYSASQPLSPQPGSSGAPIARVQFELPEQDLGTKLDVVPPRYWELELVSERKGLDYRARLLMPVYGR